MRAPRLWRYVLRYDGVARDGGFAPYVSGDLCSLACCKPTIRRYAVRGDWIIGFAPANVSRGKAIVRCAMVVTEDPMPFAEYWRRHGGRRDAIYRAEGNGLVWVANANRDHPDLPAQKRDISGVNALLSRRYRHFGEPGEDLFAALRPQFPSDRECEEVVRRVYFGGRGQKYNGLAAGDFACIRAWLEGVFASASEKIPTSLAPAALRPPKERRCSATGASRPSRRCL